MSSFHFELRQEGSSVLNSPRKMSAALCFVSCVAGRGCCGKNDGPDLEGGSGGGAGAGGRGVANGVAVAEAAVGLPISAMKRLLNGGPAASLLLPKGTAEQRAEVRVSVGIFSCILVWAWVSLHASKGPSEDRGGVLHIGAW